ncbi:MAG: non-heme iron oxygenase ferredoxin subunit [Rhodospirillaceae bacterium]|nr:MAG: non-heme iron oxygenase ferredoxin subunit [Rhodospirillaceae bacterium]
MDSIFERIIATDDIPENKSKAVQAGGQSILICHVRGKFYALQNRCSHAETTLERARFRGDTIMCPLHGARFDLATGAVRNPPAVTPICVYPLKIIDGWIYVSTQAAPLAET